MDGCFRMTLTLALIAILPVADRPAVALWLARQTEVSPSSTAPSNPVGTALGSSSPPFSSSLQSSESESPSKTKNPSTDGPPVRSPISDANQHEEVKGNSSRVGRIQIRWVWQPREAVATAAGLESRLWFSLDAGRVVGVAPPWDQTGELDPTHLAQTGYDLRRVRRGLLTLEAPASARVTIRCGGMSLSTELADLERGRTSNMETPWGLLTLVRDEADRLELDWADSAQTLRRGDGSFPVGTAPVLRVILHPRVLAPLPDRPEPDNGWRVLVRGRLSPLRGGPVIWSHEWTTQTPPGTLGNLAPIPLDCPILLPLVEGSYRLDLIAEWNDAGDAGLPGGERPSPGPTRNLLGRLFPRRWGHADEVERIERVERSLVVVARRDVMSDTAAGSGGFPGEPQGVLVDTVDLTRNRIGRNLAKGRDPLGHHTRAFTSADPGRLELGLAPPIASWLRNAAAGLENSRGLGWMAERLDGQLPSAEPLLASWIALPTRIQRVGFAHRLTITVRATRPEDLELAVLALPETRSRQADGNGASRSSPGLLASGRADVGWRPLTQNEPDGKAEQRGMLSWIVWPDRHDLMVAARNLNPTDPVWIEQVTLEEWPVGLTPWPRRWGGPIEPADSRRGLVLDLDDPESWRRLGCDPDDWGFDPVAAAQRMSAQLRHLGMDALVIPASWGLGAGWTVSAPEPRQGPNLAPDPGAVVAALLAREGFGIWLRLDGEILEISNAPSVLAADAQLVWATRIDRVIARFIERVGRTPAGVWVELDPVHPAGFGREHVIDDVVYHRFLEAAFDQETARRLRERDQATSPSERGVARVKFLKQTACLPWTDWIGTETARFHTALASWLARNHPQTRWAVRLPPPDPRLLGPHDPIRFDPGSGSDPTRANTLAASREPSAAEVWRSLGLDLARWVGDASTSPEPLGSNDAKPASHRSDGSASGADPSCLQVAPIAVREWICHTSALDLAHRADLDAALRQLPARGVSIRAASRGDRIHQTSHHHRPSPHALPPIDPLRDLLVHAINGLNADWVILDWRVIEGRQDTIRHFSSVMRRLPRSGSVRDRTTWIKVEAAAVGVVGAAGGNGSTVPTPDHDVTILKMVDPEDRLFGTPALAESSDQPRGVVDGTAPATVGSDHRIHRDSSKPDEARAGANQTNPASSGGILLVLSNPSPLPMRLDLPILAAGSTPVRDLSQPDKVLNLMTGREVGLEMECRCISLELAAYETILIKIDRPAGEIEIPTARFRLSASTLHALEQRARALAGLVNLLSRDDAVARVPNSHQPVSVVLGPIPKDRPAGVVWTARGSATRLRFDPKPLTEHMLRPVGLPNRPEDLESPRSEPPSSPIEPTLWLEADQVPAAAFSDAFRTPIGSRYTLTTHLKSQNGSTVVRIWLEGQTGSQSVLVSRDVMVGSDWTLARLTTPEFPEPGGEWLRVHLELLEPGGVMVDRVVISGDPASLPAIKRRGAARDAMKALQAYRESRFADFVRLLESPAVAAPPRLLQAIEETPNSRSSLRR